MFCLTIRMCHMPNQRLLTTPQHHMSATVPIQLLVQESWTFHLIPRVLSLPARAGFKLSWSGDTLLLKTNTNFTQSVTQNGVPGTMVATVIGTFKLKKYSKRKIYPRVITETIRLHS